MSGDLKNSKSEKQSDISQEKKKKKRSRPDVEPQALASEEAHTKKKRKSSEAVDEKLSDSDNTKIKKSKKDKKRKKSESLEPLEPDTPGSNEDVQAEKTKKQRREGNGATDNLPPADRERKKKHKQKGEPSPSSTENAPSPVQVKEFLEKNSITITTPNDQPIIPCMSFDQLKVDNQLRISFNGFKQPTPIQACTWPPAMEGKDVVGIAETGSGKTLAFGIPAMTRLIGSKAASITTLIVAPTRELAIQTHDTLSELGKPFGIASVAIYGGVPKEPQVKMLAASKSKSGLVTRIVVGTPGRIIDLVNDGACDLSNVDYLVLDEADRMLDKGFENDIRKIISLTKQGTQRQTMMFSATWPESVRRLASTFQQDPVRVTVGSDDLTANSRVEQVVEVLDNFRDKDSKLLSHLRSIVKNSNNALVLVFALYKKEASRIEQTLRQKGFGVGALHGDMSQNARLDALAAFKTGKTPVLVATDVAARGLDIPNVNSVINYTFPLTIEDYIHRIGRTGRGGKFGKSVTFFTGENHEKALAGELARVLRESGFENDELRKRFPMTIKKKTHGAYGAFFREDTGEMKAPTRIVFS